MKTTIKLAGAAVALAGAALISAGGASASPDPDSTYLALLRYEHIGNANGPAAAITAAHEICGMRIAGDSEPQAVEYLYRASGLDHFDATFVVSASEAIYCSDYWPGTYQLYPPSQQIA